jgi:hypothetical protein
MMTLKLCLLQVLEGTVQFHTCQTTLGENENGMVCFNSFSEKPNTSISAPRNIIKTVSLLTFTLFCQG